MLSYRPPCGASSAWACWWSWSASSVCGDPTTTGRGRAIGSAAGHRRQEADLIALRDRRRQPVEVADVLAVDVDVDEPVELAVDGQELALQRGVRGRQRLHDGADR